MKSCWSENGERLTTIYYEVVCGMEDTECHAYFHNDFRQTVFSWRKYQGGHNILRCLSALNTPHVKRQRPARMGFSTPFQQGVRAANCEIAAIYITQSLINILQVFQHAAQRTHLAWAIQRKDSGAFVWQLTEQKSVQGFSINLLIFYCRIQDRPITLKALALAQVGKRSKCPPWQESIQWIEKSVAALPIDAHINRSMKFDKIVEVLFAWNFCVQNSQFLPKGVFAQGQDCSHFCLNSSKTLNPRKCPQNAHFRR